MLRLAISPAGSLVEPGERAAPPTWLGDAERARWQGLGGPARDAFAASRRLLRRLLADATSVPPDHWDLSARAASAPVATKRPDGETGPACSLAHRLDWVAAAVRDGGRVGVDVECTRALRSAPEERAALMLSSGELAAWRALPAAAREAALLCTWVAKEAWFKAMPEGEAPWDFRGVVARPAAPAEANVRTWRAGTVFVGLCCDDAVDLAAAACSGLPAAPEGLVDAASWRVGRA